MSKKNFLKLFVALIFLSLSCQNALAQVGIGTTTPRGSLEINSSTNGFVPPQVALTASNVSAPVVNPQGGGAPINGTIVYNTATAGVSPNNVIPGFYYWNGTSWLLLSSQNGTVPTDWTLTGNTATNASTNFVGTTDAVDFVTRTNNTEKMRVTSAGNVGISSTAPTSLLEVGSSSTGASAAITTKTATSVSAFTPASFANYNGGVIQSTYPGGATGQVLNIAATGANSGNWPSQIALHTRNNAGTNASEKVRITDAGNVGIGTSTPTAKVDVAAGTTTTQTVVNATGSINDFLQFNVQNTSTGTQAQSGYSATADNGTATTGFAWMGINNSTFNFPTAYNIGSANDVTYVGSGQDMHIANANNSKSIIFSTGRATTPFFNERMRITNAGNVGIGTTTPNAPLQFSNGIANRKIVLWEGTNNDHQFYGFGINNNTLRYQVDVTSSNHVFYAATSSTTSNELLRIQGNGLVGIGTSTPIAKLDLTGIKSGAGTGTGGANDAATQAAIPGGSNGTSRFNDWPGGWGGGLSVYDIVGASTFFNSYLTRSDIKLKKEIKNIDTSIFDNFMKIRPVTYFMKENSPETEGLHYGFIAQEIKELFPSMVTKSDDPNGTIGMNYQALISPTIYVVQKQQAKIEALQQQVDSQNKALSKMENELKEIKELLSKK